MRTLLLLAAMLLETTAIGAEPNLKRGEKTFNEICAACHGATGLGDGPAGTGLDPRPRNFTDATLMLELSDEHMIKIVTEGGPAVGKSPFMPAWGGVLKPADVVDVVAFVRTFAPPPAAP